MKTDERLAQLKEAINEKKAPQVESVRTILSWFGAKRRGSRVLAEIERAFIKNQLCTVPPLSEPWFDASVQIHLDETAKAEAPTYDALIARLAHLNAANQVPASVSRDQALEVATTIMLRHDFSQLPVMRNEREVEGFISWRTVGEARVLGHTPKAVRDCMERRVRVLDANTPLTDAIHAIVENEFIMVRASDQTIKGPVTTTDLSERYHSLAEPFLLIGEIESAIRRILAAHAPMAILKAAKFGDDVRCRLG